MKDYKTDIRKQIDDYAKAYHGEFPMPDETIETILHIFREIVQECVGEMEKVPEVVQTKGIHFVNEHKPIHRNQLRSEILSNIEKVIK